MAAREAERRGSKGAGIGKGPAVGAAEPFQIETTVAPGLEALGRLALAASGAPATTHEVVVPAASGLLLLLHLLSPLLLAKARIALATGT